MKQLDTLYINDLIISCILGAFEEERKEKQQIIINVVLFVDTRRAGKSDNLKDTVNYHELSLRIVELVENSKFYLLEKLAQKIAELSLSDKRVKKVTIRIEKPKAVKMAKSSAIEITRSHEESKNRKIS
jgi:D-erythro-7,8-dihydroneopterin triphosphate epimerase